jgi:hypothetical protein
MRKSKRSTAQAHPPSPPIATLRRCQSVSELRPFAAFSRKEPVPHAMQAESGLHPNIDNAKCRNGRPQRLQGAARGLIPIDCAAIWYQLVDLKAVTRLAGLRLPRLALALTWRAELWRMEPWRTDPWRAV